MGKTKKQKFMVFTQRDGRLVYFLFKNKVAALNQIKAETFPNNHITVARRRLAILIRFGYVQRKAYVDEETSKLKILYSATQRGLKRCEEVVGYEFDRREVKSGAPEHDLNLLEIQKQFLRSQSIIKWYTENELCSHPICIDDEELEPYTKYRLDGAAQVISRDGSMKKYFGIEYERTQKMKSRYMDKIAGPFHSSGIFGMFYICETQAIIKQIKACMKEYDYPEEERQVYFALKDDVLSATESFKLTNSFGHKIEIRLQKPRAM